MLSIFLGTDDFSKKEQIGALAKDKGAEVEFFVSKEEVGDLARLTEQNLFSKHKIFVLEGLASQFEWSENLEKLIQSANHIILVEEKLDKRFAALKILVKDERIQIKDFPLPHGPELNRWIQQRVKQLGGNISSTAVEVLAIRLGRDEGVETKIQGRVVEVKEAFNLWQAENEIKKLLAFVRGRQVDVQDVENLVSENLEADALKITNAIADKNKDLALKLIDEFLSEQTGADEKSRVIQLNALLAEQFRNVALVQDLLKQKMSEDKILEKTGWRSGRLFIIKKIASRFGANKVLDLLGKLAALDEEMKTSATPPRVLLDLILVQVF